MSDNICRQPIKILTFQINNQEFSIDIMNVREIRRRSQTTPLPFVPKYIKGVINLRGTILPIIDLAERLGMPSDVNNERNVFIIVNIENKLAGLMVNSVSDIITVLKDELQQEQLNKSSNKTNPIESLAVIDERLIRILDLSQVISQIRQEAA